MTSIRRRLTLWLLVCLTAILASGGSLFYFCVRSVLLAEFDSALQMRAQALASLVKWEEGHIEFEFADEHMPSFERKEDPDFFQIWIGPASAGVGDAGTWGRRPADPGTPAPGAPGALSRRAPEDGEYVERSVSLGSSDLPERGGPIDRPEFWDLALPGGNPGRAVGLRFRPETEAADRASANFTQHKDAEVTIVVAKNRSTLDAALRAIGIALVSIGCGVLLAAIFIVRVAVHRGIRPLDALASRVAAIDAATLSERFAADAMPAELRPICARLNELLARLDESFQRERRFSANVAHELRTPVAELRSMAEVALKYPEDGGESWARDRFQDALDIALQMEKSVEALLILVRCQSGQQMIRSEPVNVSEMIDDVWRPLEAAARSKGLITTRNVPGAQTLKTDPAVFRTIIHNLLSNAVEYTPDRGRVTVSAASDNGRFELQVDNASETLGPDDLPRLFEPFWRKDAARSNSSHAGLGLTMAAECARILSMEIVAELVPGQGLRMTLRGMRGGVGQ